MALVPSSPEMSKSLSKSWQCASVLDFAPKHFKVYRFPSSRT